MGTLSVLRPQMHIKFVRNKKNVTWDDLTPDEIARCTTFAKDVAMDLIKVLRTECRECKAPWNCNQCDGALAIVELVDN